MRWVSPVPVSSYGKVAAPVTSAAGLAPTPAEGEPGAVAGPEAPERQGRPWRSHSPPGAADQHRLGRLQLVTLSGPTGRVEQTTMLTTTQRELFTATRVARPLRVTSLQPT